MTWLLWRQHRFSIFVIGVVLALFTVAVVLTGIHMANVYDDYLRSCGGNGTCGFAGNLFSGYGAIIDTVHLSLAVPLLFGAFGAVLVARETEQSTNVLVWTQTVTRRQWMISKVLAALLITIVTSAAVTALVTWWSGTPNALNGNRFEGTEFDTQNLLPIAFAVFALALGLAAGCLLRRVLPAIAATVGGYAVLRVLVAVYLRPHYMKPLTRVFPLGADAVPSGSWTISESIVDASGHAASSRIPVPPSCAPIVSKATANRCLSQLGLHDLVKFQPAARYWHFQLVEAGLFLVLAAALVTVAVAYTLRRDA